MTFSPCPAFSKPRLLTTHQVSGSTGAEFLLNWLVDMEWCINRRFLNVDKLKTLASTWIHKYGRWSSELTGKKEDDEKKKGWEVAYITGLGVGESVLEERKRENFIKYRLHRSFSYWTTERYPSICSQILWTKTTVPHGTVLKMSPFLCSWLLRLLLCQICFSSFSFLVFWLAEFHSKLVKHGNQSTGFHYNCCGFSGNILPDPSQRHHLYCPR